MPHRDSRQTSSHQPTRCAHASLLLYFWVGNLVVDACVDELEQAPHTALGWIRQWHAKVFQKGRHTSSCFRKFRQERDSGEPTNVCQVPPRACVCTTWGGRMSQCDAAGARSSLFTEDVPIMEKLAGLAHQKRNPSGGSNPWG